MSYSAEKIVATLRSGAKFSLRHPWIWMLLIAFALRFAIIMIDQPHKFSDTTHHFWFGAETGSIARSVAQGEGFSSPFTSSTGPTAMIGPVYVYMVAGVFKISGVLTPRSQIIILCLNSLFSALTAPVIYLLAKKITDKPTASLAGWAWAVIPSFMTLATTWIWETVLSALLVSVAVLFAIHLCEHVSWRKWVAFGLFWGFAALTNPALLSIFLISLVWIASRYRRARLDYARRIVIATLACIATISPWLIRNRVVFGQWTFIRDNFGYEFYLDNHEIRKGEAFYSVHPTASPTEWKLYKSMGELAYISLNKDKAFSYVRQNPGRFIRRTGQRMIDFWTGGAVDYLLLLSSPPAEMQSKSIFSLLTFVGLMFAGWTKMRHWPLCAAIILLYPAPYYITNPLSRYRHPIEPVMMVVAAYFVVQAARVVSRGFSELAQHLHSNTPNEDVPF